MAAALVATNDDYVLLCSILRKRREVMELCREKLRRELPIPADIDKMYRVSRETLARWIKDNEAGQPMLYSREEYDARAKLAQWLVARFHEINGTQPPDVSIWGICFQDAGVQKITDTGLFL